MNRRLCSNLPHESEIYERVRTALLDRFEPKGECYLWVTANKIPEEVKEFLDTDALMILSAQKRRPDLTGYIIVEKPHPSISKRVIVVEVKDSSPSLEDIYQTKKYADLFSAEYAFLISTERLTTIRWRFLQGHPHMLKFGVAYWNIAVMYLQEDGTLEHDRNLRSGTPFATTRLEEAFG